MSWAFVRARCNQSRLIAFVGLLLAAASSPAEALVRYGGIQITGNVQSQNLFRIQGDDSTFSSFDPIQQRNTFRLQYEQALVEGGNVTGLDWRLPFIDRAAFFAYYRFVYDSIYDIAPGGFLRTQDGGSGGKISDFRGGDRSNVAFENVIREIFLDLDSGPVSFRIGRQQIVWGEALNFRALDSNNPLDLTWHLQQEAGILGKTGFDELRIPSWAIKMLVSLGSFGPFQELFLEAYDIPFDFKTDEIRFSPAPFSFPLRNPFRGGLVLDAGDVLLGVPGPLLVQPCFDVTGNTATNAGANVDFTDSDKTGFCNSRGLKESTLREGLYDTRDPKESNQFGVRIGGSGPKSIGFTVNYLYRRNLGVGVPGSFIAKIHVPKVLANPLGYTQLSPHETFDPITRETTFVGGFARVPIEFYFPYVHIFGFSANYAEDYTGSVVALETTYTKDLPIAQANAMSVPGGIKKKDVILGALSVDRPTWIRFLNRRSTFLLIGQLNYNFILDHEDVRYDARGVPVAGDVQAPNLTLVDGLFGDGNRIDRLKEVELLSLFVVTTFYRGGSLIPIFAWINDWSNMPAMEFLLAADYYATNAFIVTPAIRIFSNFGRTVDDPFAIGRLSQNDEVQLRFTYQF